MILTDDQMRRMEMDARRFAGAYTGTSGTLASHTLNLIRHIRATRLSRPNNEKLDLFLEWLESFAVPSIRHGESESAMAIWHKTSETLPPVGQDVLVYFVEDSIDVYAVARLEESGSGEIYWESDSDEVHGMSRDYVSHWSELPVPPTNL